MCLSTADGKLPCICFSDFDFAGVGITNALTMLRQAVDPNWAPPNAPQNVLATSAAYGTYMSVSSNLRYQVLAGARPWSGDKGLRTWGRGSRDFGVPSLGLGRFASVR